jgi:hypothetical protein
MRFSSALSLLCLTSPVSAGLFNRKNDDGRRRLTENPQVEDWDMDASTGTVRKIRDPKEEEAKTCDGQMAKSLVKANDDMLQAQSNSDAAVKGLKEAESANAHLEQEYQNYKTVMTAKLETLDGQLEQAKEDAAKTVEKVTKENHELAAKAEAKAQEAIAKLQEENKDLEALKGSEIEGLKEISRKQEQKLIAEANAKFQLYESEKETKIEELTQILKGQEQKEKNSVEAAVAKVEQEKTTAVKALEQEKEVIAAEIAKIKKSLAEQVASFESQKKEFKSELKELKNKSGKTIKDLEHWENLYASRSYCNVTHLTEDASSTAMVYKEIASGKLREFKETASVSARKLQVETVRLANENMEKPKRLAQEAVAKARPHYEKTVKPHFDKATEAVKPYVDQATVAAKPFVDKFTVAAKPYVEKAAAMAKEEITVAMEIANNKTEETFDKVVANYAGACPKASASVKNFAKEKNFQLPASMLHSMDASCQQPRESVIMALYVLGVIFVLLFRKALFRLVKWLILLPIRILWFFNPLRFCFATKEKTIPAPTKAAPSGATPVRIKKKKQPNSASTPRVSQ